MKYFFKCVSCTQKGIKKGYIKGATAQGGGRNLNFCRPSHHLSKKINALHLLHLLKLLKKILHAATLKQKKLGNWLAHVSPMGLAKPIGRVSLAKLAALMWCMACIHAWREGVNAWPFRQVGWWHHAWVCFAHWSSETHHANVESWHSAVSLVVLAEPSVPLLVFVK